MADSGIIALFPGQGAQKTGMGKDLYDAFPKAKQFFDKADEILGFSLSSICFDGPSEELTKTKNAQPAILTLSCIAYELTKGFKNISAAIGHSLGEYSALVASESLTFEDAVLLVHKRGTYMQEAVPEGQGKMVAVLGSENETIEKACQKVSSGVAAIANINAPGQVVVSGDNKGVDEFLAHLGPAKVKALAVSAPFHSPLMKPAADRLSVDLENVHISSPTFPVYSNVYARPFENPEDIKKGLLEQVYGRVRFTECISNCCEQFHTEHACEFGPGKTLSGLLKRINQSVESSQVNSAKAVEHILSEQNIKAANA